MREPKVTVTRSSVDGAWLVFIDTDPEGECDAVGPRPLRIMLNDADLYENPVFPVDGGAITLGGEV